ncbi:isochorismatase family protein [Geomonas sp. Red32]|uniref:isochorismatase family protein n=1 Tax=Geomonas sp. Red32 TaxID=2912856 RepID=UPI00202D04EE|nr:isochorismatase family protein [Geomonas sp. Red32]MCM0083614.1 isochorismatase family protein [Geomonas sp. Red32]
MRRRGALVVVDVQVDFCPGGSLPVPEGDLVVPVLNRYLKIFSDKGSPIFATRDWHPSDSRHFQTLGGNWPVHCVQQSPGAFFHPDLALPEGTIIISKGMSRWDNGYSAMEGMTDNGTPFPMLLRRMALDRLFVGGLATDYCVKETVLGALKDGYLVTLLTDAIRGVNLSPTDSDQAIAEMTGAGAVVATLATLRESIC